MSSSGSLPPRRSYLATKLSVEPGEILNSTIPQPMFRPKASKSDTLHGFVDSLFKPTRATPKVSKFGSRATTKERNSMYHPLVLVLADLTYVWSQDVHKKGKRKVTSYPFRFPVHLIILLGTGLPKRCVPSRSAYYVSHDIAGPEVTLDPKRPGIVGRLLERLLVRFFHT